ncbi:HAD family hydrolase [Halococcoides cellulosivorans]|uniref:Haloacid dehalogenase n=1 Tax=Halococcoides cellulosivorans TaxID=1679096 RepID=A0A2R4X2C5_9EURY|nr:HAD family hydrolase [Halococcoides cellulosivorans]AWB27932.1 haloacid dehalogenase [Halococcoides cellulosivorans]
MSGVEAVLLDLDDTICEYRRSADTILAIAFDRVGVEPFFDGRAYYETFVEHTDAGETVEKIRRAAFASLARADDHDPATGRAIADAFAAERDYGNVRFLPGAEDAIESLAQQYALGLVTNGGPEMQTQKLASLGIDDRFETTVFAGTDAAPKPAAEPFDRALDALGVPAERAVHVGNSLVSDVPGAQAAGLDAVWLSDGSDHGGRPDYVLDSMAALVDPPWT